MPTQFAADGNAEALVARFRNEVWNPPFSIDLFDKLEADDLVISTDRRPVAGKEPFRVWLRDFQSGLRDLETSAEEILVADDGTRGITRLQVYGFNRGLFGTEPDGAPEGSVAPSIIALAHGKGTCDWVETSAHEIHQWPTSHENPMQV